MLTQLVASQSSRPGPTSSNSHNSSNISRIQAFFKMNPPMFTGSKVDEDPQNFIDEVEKILRVMHERELSLYPTS